MKKIYLGINFLLANVTTAKIEAINLNVVGQQSIIGPLGKILNFAANSNIMITSNNPNYILTIENAANIGCKLSNVSFKRSLIINSTQFPKDSKNSIGQITNWCLKYFTGQPCSFLNQNIFFVEQRGKFCDLVKSNFAASNKEYLIKGINGDLSMLAFNPQTNVFAFTVATEKLGVNIYFFDLATKKMYSPFGNLTKGVIVAPSFAPDGNSVLLTISDAKGFSNIMVFELASKRLTKITELRNWIDNSPVFSPDGKSIYFSSNRTGRFQIYKISKNGGGETLVFSSPYNCYSPVFSADGQKIALVEFDGKDYFINVANLDGSSKKRVASGGILDLPSFDKSGKILGFSRYINNRSSINFINLANGKELAINTSFNTKEMIWG